MVTVVHRAQPDTWSTKKAFWVEDAQQLRHIANGSLPLAKALSRDHLFSFLRTIAQPCNQNITLIHCGRQQCQAVMSLVEIFANGWITLPTVLDWWAEKNQLVLVIFDAQRPMHRSAHVRKAGDCLLKKKNQIRFFMQLEMIWIRSAHLSCTHSIFELKWDLKASS